MEQTENTAKNTTQLPASLRAIFWSYSFESLNIDKHKKLIVKQILNYGTLQDWKWMASTYGTETLRDIFSSFPQSELRPQAARLAEVLFGFTPSRYALRSTN